MRQSLQQALAAERPLQIIGVLNAYSALLAQEAGYKALYLSGAGVANSSFGLPDLGITQLADVCEDARRICDRVDLPLLVDADVGWGGAFNIARAVRDLTRAGAAGIHLEDQVGQKRCGHRPGKQLVEPAEMCDRIKAAVDSRTDDDFAIMARTDGLASEGLDAAIDRCLKYQEAGADMLFTEAVTTLDEYRAFNKAVKLPILANITEFGKTPLFTIDELESAGVAMALYPLSGFRAMSKAAEEVFATIKQQKTQKELLGKMQTREELYKTLDYYAFEEKLDELFDETDE